jgi:hypothetical protein
MDIIFYNGRVNTLNGSGTVFSAVGAANGMVSTLGSDEELRRLIKPKTEAIDLKGATMFPGLLEAHNHLTIYGYLIDGIDLSASKARKMADILASIKARAETQPLCRILSG